MWDRPPGFPPLCFPLAGDGVCLGMGGCVCTRHQDTADVGACDDNTSACARIHRRCSHRPFAPRDTEQVRGRRRTRGHATRNGRRRRKEEGWNDGGREEHQARKRRGLTHDVRMAGRQNDLRNLVR